MKNCYPDLHGFPPLFFFFLLKKSANSFTYTQTPLPSPRRALEGLYNSKKKNEEDSVLFLFLYRLNPI